MVNVIFTHQLEPRGTLHRVIFVEKTLGHYVHVQSETWEEGEQFAKQVVIDFHNGGSEHDRFVREGEVEYRVAGSWFPGDDDYQQQPFPGDGDAGTAVSPSTD